MGSRSAIPRLVKAMPKRATAAIRKLRHLAKLTRARARRRRLRAASSARVVVELTDDFDHTLDTPRPRRRGDKVVTLHVGGLDIERDL